MSDENNATSLNNPSRSSLFPALARLVGLFKARLFQGRPFNPVMACVWAVLLAEFFYIFLVLLNYYFSWMHVEVYPINTWVLSNGHSWQWEDFGRFLDIDVLEGHAGENRLSRPVSNIFEVINPKFRAWLWNFIPPHPSLSIWWLGSFLVLPIFLYRFFKNMGCNRCVALGGVALYLSSIGFLAPNVMYLRPSKSLVNIFGVLSLYAGSKLYAQVVRAQPGVSIKDIPGFRRTFFLFLLNMFIGFFCDESGVFVYVMAATLLYPVLCRPRERGVLWAVFLSMPAAYLGMILKILPWIHWVTTHKVRDVRLFDLYPEEGMFFLRPAWWRELWTNMLWLLSDHPHLQLNAAHLYPNNKPLFFAQVIYLLSMIAVGVFALRAWPNRLRPAICDGQHPMTLARVLFSAVVLVPFAVFHTLLMQQLMGLCYYGALYSLIYYIAFTFFLQWIWERSARGFACLFPLLIFIGVAHGLWFTTYRVDILDENKQEREFLYRSDLMSEREWIKRYSFTYAQIFTGQTGRYFKNFSIPDGIRKSECRYLYIMLKWKDRSGKRPPVDHARIQACNAVLAHDKTFPYESRYLKIEQ